MHQVTEAGHLIKDPQSLKVYSRWGMYLQFCVCVCVVCMLTSLLNKNSSMQEFDHQSWPVSSGVNHVLSDGKTWCMAPQKPAKQMICEMQNMCHTEEISSSFTPKWNTRAVSVSLCWKSLSNSRPMCWLWDSTDSIKALSLLLNIEHFIIP